MGESVAVLPPSILNCGTIMLVHPRAYCVLIMLLRDCTTVSRQSWSFPSKCLPVVRCFEKRGQNTKNEYEQAIAGEPPNKRRRYMDSAARLERLVSEYIPAEDVLLIFTRCSPQCIIIEKFVISNCALSFRSDFPKISRSPRDLWCHKNSQNYKERIKILLPLIKICIVGK